MGQPQILEKLSKKLASAPASEEDVVYILSRIRKILEINHYPEKYNILNFYCNLALHSEIDRVPQEIFDSLMRVRDGSDYSIIFYPHFHKQLSKFLNEYNLPNFYSSNGYKTNIYFNKLLSAVYSDTPIITKVVIKYRTTIDENGGLRGSPVK